MPRRPAFSYPVIKVCPVCGGAVVCKTAARAKAALYCSRHCYTLALHRGEAPTAKTYRRAKVPPRTMTVGDVVLTEALKPAARGDCSRYDACLDATARAEWEGFACHGCPRHAPRPQPSALAFLDNQPSALATAIDEGGSGLW